MKADQGDGPWMGQETHEGGTTMGCYMDGTD